MFRRLVGLFEAIGPSQGF